MTKESNSPDMKEKRAKITAKTVDDTAELRKLLYFPWDRAGKKGESIERPLMSDVKQEYNCTPLSCAPWRNPATAAADQRERATQRVRDQQVIRWETPAADSFLRTHRDQYGDELLRLPKTARSLQSTSAQGSKQRMTLCLVFCTLTQQTMFRPHAHACVSLAVLCPAAFVAATPPVVPSIGRVHSVPEQPQAFGQFTTVASVREQLPANKRCGLTCSVGSSSPAVGPGTRLDEPGTHLSAVTKQCVQ